jgi:hypothetical protein
MAALAAAAGVVPDISIDGGLGVVEARVLQSPRGSVLIAINHDEQPHAVTLTLAAGLPDTWRQLDGGGFTVDRRRIAWNAPKRSVLVLSSR